LSPAPRHGLAFPDYYNGLQQILADIGILPSGLAVYTLTIDPQHLKERNIITIRSDKPFVEIMDIYFSN
jgi:hypothetical protein